MQSVVTYSLSGNPAADPYLSASLTARGAKLPGASTKRGAS
jgi:hypothetical protein